ncbi:hypothetical protein ACVIIW_003648 [Bradyrhizobium sp. USDA 4449]
MTFILDTNIRRLAQAKSYEAETRDVRPIHIVGLLLILMYFVVSGSLLQALGWQYVGGGSEVEKIHPATYLIFFWFACALILDRRFRSSVYTIIAHDFALVSFALATGCAAAYAIFFKGVSIAPFVETLAATLVVFVIVVSLPARAIVLFRRAVDVIMMFSIVMIVAEYYMRQTFIPIYTGDTIYTGEMLTSLNRPAGLFGHPLAAASFLCTYGTLSVISLPPGNSIQTLVRPMLALLAFGAAATTGGRTSMVMGVFLVGLYFLFSILWSFARGRFERSTVVALPLILLISILAIPLLASMGIFDLLLLRFENDNGSAVAREYAVQILTSIPLSDLWLGIQPTDAASMQASYGVVAIEITWVNYILICGLIFTAPFFFTYLLFLFRCLPRYCRPPIYLISLFYLLLSFSSNGLWTKTTSFAAGLAMAVAFLRVPRDERAP